MTQGTCSRSKYWGGVGYDGKVDEDDDVPMTTPIKIPKKRYAFKSARRKETPFSLRKISKLINEALRHFAVDSDYELVCIQSYRVGKEARISRRTRRRTAQHSLPSV